MIRINRRANYSARPDYLRFREIYLFWYYRTDPAENALKRLTERFMGSVVL